MHRVPLDSQTAGATANPRTCDFLAFLRSKPFPIPSTTPLLPRVLAAAANPLLTPHPNKDNFAVSSKFPARGFNHDKVRVCPSLKHPPPFVGDLGNLIDVEMRGREPRQPPLRLALHLDVRDRFVVITGLLNSTRTVGRIDVDIGRR